MGSPPAGSPPAAPPPDAPPSGGAANLTSAGPVTGKRNGMIAGQILDEYNQPKPSAIIEVIDLDAPREEAVPLKVKATKEGYFDIDGLQAGHKYRLVANVKDGARVLYGTTTTVAPNPRVAIYLSAERPIADPPADNTARPARADVPGGSAGAGASIGAPIKMPSEGVTTPLPGGDGSPSTGCNPSPRCASARQHRRPFPDRGQGQEGRSRGLLARRTGEHSSPGSRAGTDEPSDPDSNSSCSAAGGTRSHRERHDHAVAVFRSSVGRTALSRRVGWGDPRQSGPLLPEDRQQGGQFRSARLRWKHVGAEQTADRPSGAPRLLVQRLRPVSKSHPAPDRASKEVSRFRLADRQYRPRERFAGRKAASDSRRAARYEINYQLLFSGGSEGGPCPVLQGFDVQEFPTLVLLDRTGKIVFRTKKGQGLDDWAAYHLEMEIRRQLNMKLTQ